MQTKTTTAVSIAILSVTAAIFAGISARFLIDPVRAAAGQGISLQTPFAHTTVRVGFGVFPLAGVIVALAGVFSAARRRDALKFIVAVFTLALVVRIASIFADHAGGALNTRLTIIEAVILAISAAVLLFDRSLAERVGFEPTVRD